MNPGVGYSSEESPPTRTLPPLVVPEIPLDDNPFSRDVFSLKELRADNEPLLKRLIATRMDFPLMIDPLGEFARELFADTGRVRFGKDFLIVIRMSPLLWHEDSLGVLQALKGELATG